MPEWSEVNHFKDILQPLVGYKLSGLVSKKVRLDLPVPSDAPTVIAVKSHGKFIWMEMDSGACLANEPMLGGRWEVRYDNRCPEKWDVSFTFTKKDAPMIIVFYYDKDWKKLSKLYWDSDGSQVKDKLSRLGPDLMSDWQLQELPLQRRGRSSLGSILLDQSVVAGIGNFIKCDALYMCKIHPDTKWSKLTAEEQSLVYFTCKHVAFEAYKCRGGAGYGGSYQHPIYKQVEDKDHNPVIKVKTKDGRDSYICPAVQQLK